MTRVDAHHHVWNLDVRDEPWITGEAMQPIRRNFALDDLRDDVRVADVSATVLVQTLSSTDETRDFLALAAADELVAAVTGWVDLTAHEVADELADLRATTGGEYLRGIRHQVHDEPDIEWLGRADVRRGLAAVGQAGLVYELLTFGEHLPISTATVAAFPDQQFVLDHCSKPPIVSGQLELWAQRIRDLAEQPNVVCKLSGLVNEATWHAWTVADLHPYVEVALDAFGPDRLMFGSDWPVCLLASSYADWVAAVEQLTAKLSPTEREAIFGGTARRVYHLDT